MSTISEVAGEFLDPIIGLQVHFHAVLVEFAVVLCLIMVIDVVDW